MLSWYATFVTPCIFITTNLNRMSEILRRIVKAKNLEENPFFKDPDSRIIEITSDKGEVFTGYYQADDGTYYTEKDWLDHQRQLELEQLAEQEYQAQQEKLAAEREARALKIAALEAMNKKNKSTGTTKWIKFFGIASILIAVIAITYSFWPRTTNIQKTTPNTVAVDTLKTSTKVNKFGNATITGTDVRMRAEPDLKGKIVTFFPDEGERIQMLQAANDSVNWAQVRRENGITGWVYGQYVKADTLQD
ncbi:MAG TPA: hypothetical protein DEA82_11430 [Flavobacteriaceae bacterium]|nr:hypothetical protein [Flavobacteriaceae bacterium]MAY51777.1 hypothetical protein [Flavobacteriaceae bacterium]HBR54747.1 hypothetical protein [Flavobacteriaceae bacterium]|tara:strand:+ start:34029 stop:34775 length:747 start_codon:yes stop_codon:yes gene_type:complete